MSRWILVLACTHRLIADDPAKVNVDIDHCPECGANALVVDCYAYRDTDV